MKQLLQEFQHRNLIPALVAGSVSGITEIFFHISLATLIFSGALSAFVPDGIGLILFGGAMIGLAVTFLGSFPGAIPVVQDTPAAVFAIAASAIVLQMPASASPQQIYFTVVAALSFTTIITGFLFIMIARFGLSGLVRFVPYPVVGGFLAGTGWLLFQGALGVMSGLPMRAADIPVLFQGDVLMRWLPGTLFAVILVVIQRRFQHPLIMPGALLAGMAVFYVFLFAADIPIAEATQRGLLLGPFPQKPLWTPLKLSALSLVDWPVVLTQSGKLISIMFLSTIALLLNASALELATEKDIDLNRELTAAGVGNILGGLGGSSVGYQTIGLSTLTHRMGGSSRTTTLVAALFLGAALLLGASLLSLFPKAIIGGLLLFLGLSFLVEWVYDAARRLPRIDYLLVLIILVIVATIGFLEGVGAGTVIAVILFAVNYSRVEFVKDTLTGESFHSNMERPVEHRQLLHEMGEQIHILRLQGFLFFGTAQNLLNRIRERIRDAGKPKLHFLILDFQHVSALDSSAVMSFTRMYQLAASNKIHLVLTGAQPNILRRLEQGGLVEGQDEYYKVFQSLDYGMEWCENRMLAEDDRSLITKAATLKAQLKKVFEAPEHIERFMKYLEKLDVGKGHALINQGDAAEAMYFIDSGQVSVRLEFQPGHFIRLRSMGGGTVVGEIGLYLKQTRTASIVTDTASTVYRLSEATLEQMERDDPDLAAALHHWMARSLAERLSDNNRTLEALLS